MQASSSVTANRDLAKALAIPLLVWMFGACSSQQNEYVEPPPPKVTVAQPLQQEVIDYLEFTGTTQAFETVEVRARVAGFLQSVEFTPGTHVDKDDLLFTIDPREYQAEVNAALAELKSAEAELKRAEIEYARAEKVFDQGAGSEAHVVEWRGKRDVARAGVGRAKAKVDQARLDLSYTKITAPIAGRVSRNLVDLGNLVGEGEPTLLTTVSNYDPMYAYFNLNERDLLRVLAMYREKIEGKGMNPDTDPDAEAEIPLFLGLAGEEGYPHEGTYDFAESGVDPGTGTLELRGIFPNPGDPPALLPGLFSRLRMPIKKRTDALLVSERAIGADQSGRYVLAVNSQNVVEKRPTLTGQLVEGLRVIEEGLRPGEWVVVNGLQRARPGAKVDPERIDMDSLTTSALKAAADAKQEKAAQAEKTGEDENAGAERSAEDVAAAAALPEASKPMPPRPSEKR